MNLMDQTAKDDFAELKTVKQSHPLTPRSKCSKLPLSTLASVLTFMLVWKNMEAAMVIFMNDVKTRRLARERAAVLNSRRLQFIASLQDLEKTSLPLNLLFPGSYDWCSFAPIKALIEQPSEVDIDFDSLASGAMDLANPESELLTEWRREVHNELFAMIRAVETEPRTLISRPLYELDDSAALNRLKLASTAFGCKQCAGEHPGAFRSLDIRFPQQNYQVPIIKPMFYPDVMGHRCLTNAPIRNYDMQTREDQQVQDVSFHRGFGQYDRAHWNTESLCLDEELGKMARNVVDAVHPDPDNATVEEMDRMNVLFMCPICSMKTLQAADAGTLLEGDDAKILYLGWRQAVRTLPQAILFE